MLRSPLPLNTLLIFLSTNGVIITIFLYNFIQCKTYVPLDHSRWENLFRCVFIDKEYMEFHQTLTPDPAVQAAVCAPMHTTFLSGCSLCVEVHTSSFFQIHFHWNWPKSNSRGYLWAWLWLIRERRACWRGSTWTHTHGHTSHSSITLLLMELRGKNYGNRCSLREGWTEKRKHERRNGGHRPQSEGRL